MLYSKSHLAVRHAASTDEARSSINGVRFHADGSTEATNGHILCRVTAETPPPGDYPTLPQGATVVGDQEPFTFPLDAVNRLVKAIPKRSHMPILEYAACDVGASNANGSARFVTTDLESAQTIDGRKLEGEWPNTAQVIPQGEPIVTIGLNLTLLGKIEKALREFKGGGQALAKLHIYDPLTAVKITAECPDVGEFLAVIMPMRL